MKTDGLLTEKKPKQCRALTMNIVFPTVTSSAAHEDSALYDTIGDISVFVHDHNHDGLGRNGPSQEKRAAYQHSLTTHASGRLVIHASQNSKLMHSRICICYRGTTAAVRAQHATCHSSRIEKIIQLLSPSNRGMDASTISQIS